jgi:protein arginine N-methyltransferase 1
MDSGQSCDFYFDSFAHYTAHEDLLNDEVRTKAWQTAIDSNPSLFRNKVVVDAGCGLCLFTMMLLKHNPSVCYGIEKSTIFPYALEVLSANDLTERVEMIHADVKDVDLGKKVDTIVCDFVGSCMILDSMLPELIGFRNRCLKPDGCVFPTHASLWIAGLSLEDYAARVYYWRNVYGFNFQCIGARAVEEGVFEDVKKEAIMSESCMVWEIQSKTVQVADLNADHSFSFRATRTGDMNSLVLWFDAQFVGPDHTNGFSTSPYNESTTYSHTLLFLRNRVQVCVGEEITGILSIRMNAENPRNLDLTVDYSATCGSFSQRFSLRS